RGYLRRARHRARWSSCRAVFQRCRELFEEVQTEGMVDPSFKILSMGMSGDYEVAIEEGANLVRVGSSIFGSTTTDDAEPTPAPEAD
ncbi:MAG: YggS family pyridoxal phosphate-dependent enzyme, partial [Planctomycetota bacterium]